MQNPNHFHNIQNSTDLFIILIKGFLWEKKRQQIFQGELRINDLDKIR